MASQLFGCWSRGKTTDFDSVIVGSNPAHPTILVTKKSPPIMKEVNTMNKKAFAVGCAISLAGSIIGGITLGLQLWMGSVMTYPICAVLGAKIRKED